MAKQAAKNAGNDRIISLTIPPSGFQLNDGRTIKTSGTFEVNSNSYTVEGYNFQFQKVVYNYDQNKKTFVRLSYPTSATVSSYLSCKGKYIPLTSTDYTGLILNRLKLRCPKLEPNRTWVKHYCDELDKRAKLYLDTLNKLSIADLKTIGNSLNINFGWLGGAGPSKNYLKEMIFNE